MIPRRDASPAVEDQGTGKARYSRFFWPILRGIALIAALWTFIPFLGFEIYGRDWWPALPVFMVASFVLILMTRRNLKALEISPPSDSSKRFSRVGVGPRRDAVDSETPPGIDGEGIEKAKQRPLPEWSLLAYCLLTGLGYNWVCAFFWFSRRYDMFSAPVVGATGLILAVYASIAIFAAGFTGGNWRTALLVFVVETGTLAPIVLRLRLLR